MFPPAHTQALACLDVYTYAKMAIFTVQDMLFSLLFRPGIPAAPKALFEFATVLNPAAPAQHSSHKAKPEVADVGLSGFWWPLLPYTCILCALSL